MNFKCPKCQTIIKYSDASTNTCLCGETSILREGKAYSIRMRSGEGEVKTDLKIDVNENAHENKNQNEKKESEEPRMTKEQLLELLYDQIKHSDNLPIHVRNSYITYIDFESMMLLVYAILKG